MRKLEKSQLLVMAAAIALGLSVQAPLLLVPLIARPSLLDLYGLQQHPLVLAVIVLFVILALLMVVLAMKKAWRILIALSLCMILLWGLLWAGILKSPAYLLAYYPVVRSEYKDEINDIVAGIGPLWGFWLLLAVFVVSLLVSLVSRSK